MMVHFVRTSRFVLLCGWLLAFSSAVRADGRWTETTWQGEKAYVARQGEIEAIVSVARSRLIYFGPAAEAQNLLSAPTPLTAPTRDLLPNWGGHRFWLGPQSRWSWPPLPEWEYSATETVDVKNDTLVLVEAQRNPAYPRLTREYTWDGPRLRSTVRWKADGRPYYAMHVVAIDTPAELSAQLKRWDHVPHGFVGVKGDAPITVNPLPHPAVTVEGETAILRAGVATAKLGFYPQTLDAPRGAWTLSVSPGPSEGVPIESPDLGYLSQIWVGPPGSTFCELEQLTPYLLGDASGNCSSTIFFGAAHTLKK